MKLEQKWYSAARGTLFAAVLLLCLAGGIRGGLGLVFPVSYTHLTLPTKA